MENRKEFRSVTVGETQYMAKDVFGNMIDGVVQHPLVDFDSVARLASVLVEKWGMVAGVPDGEDSAGRSKLGLMPPDQIVNRAVATAELLIDRLKMIGHISPVPTIEELGKDYTEDKAKED